MAQVIWLVTLSGRSTFLPRTRGPSERTGQLLVERRHLGVEDFEPIQKLPQFRSRQAIERQLGTATHSRLKFVEGGVDPIDSICRNHARMMAAPSDSPRLPRPYFCS